MIGEKGPEAVIPLGRAGQPQVTLVYNQNAPNYGLLDFEQEVARAWANARRGGAFRGLMGDA